MTCPKEPEGFRIIIVGGGITGLTLANALQNAGADFLLLESRSEMSISSQHGETLESSSICRPEVMDPLILAKDACIG